MINISKILMVSIVIMTVVAAFSIYAVADSPVGDFPSPPGSAPSSSSNTGSSGSSGNSGYSPPVFTPFSIPLKSSDGMVIGHLDGKNFNSVLVWAEKNGTAGNMSYDLVIQGELSSSPSDNCWMDISFIGPVKELVPPGWENDPVLATINITTSPNSWSYTSSPKYTLNVTGVAQTISADDPYYLVMGDGSNYQLQKISLDVAGGHTIITFSPPKNSGEFMIMRAPMATPSPTPTPTPLPTTTPTPDQQSDDSGIGAYTIYIALVAISAIVGGAIVFLLMRGRQG
jgi:hypothetical protein